MFVLFLGITFIVGVSWIVVKDLIETIKLKKQLEEMEE